jgi:nucleoside-diphosphate-sugar epimerase
MSTQRILVTGADGCVGGAIVAGLRAAGHTVHGQVFARAAGPDETRLDLTQPGATAALPAGFDVVVHAAGNVNPRVPTATMFAINAGGTKAMLRWTEAGGGGHFIQISSVSVYGPRAIGLNRREDNTPRRRWLGVPYARSKAAAELAVERAGVPHTILRLPMVIGAGDVFATPVIADALSSGRFFLAGSGRRKVSLLTVTSVGSLLNAVIERGPSGCALNVADHHVSWQELTRAYAKTLGVVYAPKRARMSLGLLRSSASAWGFLFGYSLAGGEFPTDKLERHLGALPLMRWQQAVADAVGSWSSANVTL